MLTASPWVAAEPAGYRLLSLGGYPVRWMPRLETGRIVLTYKVVDRTIDQPNAINCKGIRPPDSILRTSAIELDAFRDALSAAFRRWRDVADLTFVEVQPNEKANILIGEQTEPIGFAFTNLELAGPENGVRAIVGASICLNPKRHWKIGYDGNLAVYDLVHTFAHEIGHVIGLDHPVGRANLMAFRYSESLSGLSEGDRRGAVSLYGPSRMRSEIVALPATTAGPTRVTTTIGRSIDGGASD
jgi:predicted Zn-dependent protease